MSIKTRYTNSALAKKASVGIGLPVDTGVNYTPQTICVFFIAQNSIISTSKKRVSMMGCVGVSQDTLFPVCSKTNSTQLITSFDWSLIGDDVIQSSIQEQSIMTQISSSATPVANLCFNEISLRPVVHNQQFFLTSAELAKALGYADVRSVTKIYNRYADEFSVGMTTVVNLTTNGINGSTRQLENRIFSLRGCHLVAMFARTPIAKEFRKWVLDILDKELDKPNRKKTLMQRELFALFATSLQYHLDYAKKLHQLLRIAPNPILETELKWVVEHVHEIIDYCYENEITMPSGKPIFKQGSLNFLSGNSIELNQAFVNMMGLSGY